MFLVNVDPHAESQPFTLCGLRHTRQHNMELKVRRIPDLEQVNERRPKIYLKMTLYCEI